MNVKTTYQAARDAFNNYPKGFAGKISLKEIKESVKAFNKIRTELGAFEEALKTKTAALEKFAEENKKNRSEVVTKTEELNKEINEMDKNFELDLTNDEIKSVKKTVEEIVFEKEDKKDSNMLLNITKFIEDLEEALK